MKTKKIILFILKFFIILIFWWSIFLFFKLITDSYINIDLSNKNITIIKKHTKEIIIPYIYTYSDNKKIIDYEKWDDWQLHTIEKLEKRIEKKYWDNMKKHDLLYDMFYNKRTKKSYEVNLSDLWKYNFVELLDTFSSAPFYDKKNNTLYIFAHSSWKIINIWREYFDMEVWDEFDFLDYDWNISDEYFIENKDIVTKREFYDKIFMNSIKNRIVLVTCYPLNSTAKRLYLTLKKKDSVNDRIHNSLTN